MIQNANRMAKVTGKLIFRNKGFIFIGVVIPFLATLLINLWVKERPTTVEDTVIEIESMDEHLQNSVNYNCLCVKVYASRNDENSISLCRTLARKGLFQIFRVDTSAYTYDEIMENARFTALNDKVGAILLLHPEEEIELYQVGEDKRFDLFKDSLLSGIALQKFKNAHPEAELPSESIKSEMHLLNVNSGTDIDYYSVREVGYCIAIVTIAFVFGGILILGVVLNEKQDNVYSRIMLTGADRRSYILSKAIVVIAVSLVQTLSMIICFMLFVKVDLGMNVFQFGCIMLAEGIVFNFLSLCVGLLINSVVAGSVMGFAVWSVSSLLSGAYFDISGASEWFKKIAVLMPQRWAMIWTGMIKNSEPNVYLCIFLVTLAYLFVILVIGLLGFRMNEND